jgi:wyosine [tRNA(Phe)-imidazoG37] synthetase (radical SAM superfamily)
VQTKDFRFIYGPVASWRLGVSLGIDLLSPARKICNFDCIYCQLGKTLRYTKKPRVFVKTSEIIKELNRLPKIKIDYITFSGRGEPTLAKNLGEAIRAVKKLKIAPVAVLTNASLIGKSNIRKKLSFADFVIAKLDAYSQESLERINQPAKGVKFEEILRGIKRFRKAFKGKFALQMMFVEKNKEDAERLAKLAREIDPDEVQINTPLRPCKVRPLSKKELDWIKKYFSGLNFVSVYDVHPRRVIPLSKKETLRRRGKIKV